MSYPELAQCVQDLGELMLCFVGAVRAMSWAEIWGTFFGVLGTALLAIKSPWSGFGFLSYLASNAAWFIFAFEHHHLGLMLQQGIFTGFSLVGVWIWLVVPGMDLFGNWVDSMLDWGDTP